MEDHSSRVAGMNRARTTRAENIPSSPAWLHRFSSPHRLGRCHRLKSFPGCGLNKCALQAPLTLTLRAASSFPSPAWAMALT